jgi:altronate hydrolase
VTASKILQLDPRDNVLVALTDLTAGDSVSHAGQIITLQSAIPAKHKLAIADFPVDGEIFMYGVVVGRARHPIAAGELLTTANVIHESAGFSSKAHETKWLPPDVSRWQGRTFDGYHRADGQVGTRNYWLVIPLVFCENRNVDALREAFEEELGYGRPKQYRQQVRELLDSYRTEAGQGTTEPSEDPRTAKRRHQVPPPPGWLRRYARRFPRPLRPARRLHPPPQRRRCHRPQPWLPECPNCRSDG